MNKLENEKAITASRWYELVFVNMVLLFHYGTKSDKAITNHVYLTPATICWEPMVEP